MRGKVALITGGSRGIGEAIAKKFKDEGAEVLVPSRSELDLLSCDSITEYCSSLKVPVDILVNNAGISRLSDCTDIPNEDINDIVQVNMSAPIILTREIARGMRARGYGRIVNISSIWAFVSKEKRLVYAATKAGIIAVTRTSALELAADGVLVNGIAPGYVNTELTARNNPPEVLEEARKTIPVKRLAEVEEIAVAVAFLASSKNTYITGQTILVDGGYTCR